MGDKKTKPKMPIPFGNVKLHEEDSLKNIKLSEEMIKLIKPKSK